VNEYGLYLNLATLVAIAGGIIRLTLGVSSAKGELQKGIDQTEAELRTEYTEKIAALTLKVHEMETWNRDNFVRRDSFERVVGALEKSVEKIGEKIDAKFDALTKRIDEKR
jgi:hypothetical protein